MDSLKDGMVQLNLKQALRVINGQEILMLKQLWVPTHLT